MLWALILLAIANAPFVLAETIDLGDLAKYDNTTDKCPMIDTNTIWMSGKPGQGFDLCVSPDLQPKVTSILDACADLDQKCIQDVQSILLCTKVDFNKDVDRRVFTSYVAEVFEMLEWFMASAVNTLMVNWKIRRQQTERVHIPADMVDAYHAVVTAKTTTFSAQGSAVMTVAQTAESTTLSGSVMPQVTKAPSSDDDLVAILDKDTASALNDIVQANKDCNDGREFDKKHQGHIKAFVGRKGSLGQVICATESAVMQAVPGGVLNNLLMIDEKNLPLGIAPNLGDVSEAYDLSADFLSSNFPIMSLSGESVDKVTALVFVLSYGAIMLDKPIGGANAVSGDIATYVGGGSPVSTSSCPDPTATPLWCGNGFKEVCDIRLPKPTGHPSTPVCHSGPFENCPCINPSYRHRLIIGDSEQKFIDYVASRLGQPDPSPTASPTPTASVHCADLGSVGTLYLSRDSVAKSIEEEYCPKWEGVSSGIGLGTYLINTPETFELGITGIGDKAPTVDDCKKHLYEVLDGCDTDSKINPMNWKAGGYTRVDGWNYTITPLHDRPPFRKTPLAKCSYARGCLPGAPCQIWMHGTNFCNSDFGAALKQSFQRGQPNPWFFDPSQGGGRTGWDLTDFDTNFKYNLTEDEGVQWEWHVEMFGDKNTGDKLIEQWVPGIMKSAANRSDPEQLQLNCHPSL